MVKCPNCGGELKFSPKDQEVVCPMCSSKFNPKELNATVKHANERPTADLSGTSYTCSQCGATLMSFDETAVTFCNFCDSQALIESKMSMNRPDYIIPFKKTKEECIAEYKRILNKNIFTPKYMKTEMVFNKFRGIFMPYGIYNVGFHGNSSNKGSKYSHRSGDYRIYDDYSINAHVDASYEGISYDLASNFYDEYSNAIPFNYNEKEDFNYNYLIGYYADTCDVDDSIYDDNACAVGSSDSTNQLNKYNDFAKYGCYSPSVKMSITDKKRAMYPVYFVSIKDKTGKRIHYCVINGQTGKIAIDLPIDFVKYMIGSLLLAIPIFALLYFGPVITNVASSVITLIASFIALIISWSQMSKIKKRESHAEDEGFNNINKEEKKKTNSTFKERLKNNYKLWLAIIISGLVLLLQPVSDLYYYGATVVSLVLIILSFRNIIKEYNLLVSRPLPQLNKRGGDLSE